jgi:hypothetical protein
MSHPKVVYPPPAHVGENGLTNAWLRRADAPEDG